MIFMLKYETTYFSSQSSRMLLISFLCSYELSNCLFVSLSSSCYLPYHLHKFSRINQTSTIQFSLILVSRQVLLLSFKLVSPADILGCPFMVLQDGKNHCFLYCPPWFTSFSWSRITSNINHRSESHPDIKFLAQNVLNEPICNNAPCYPSS